MFDNTIFLLQKHGGVSRYFYELNNHVNRNQLGASWINAPLHFNQHLRDYVNPDNRNLFIPFSTDKYNFNSRIRRVSNSLAKKRLLEKSPDIIHESFYNEDNIWNVNLPFVTTIHDMIREKISYQELKSKRKKGSVNRATKIICVSENTKRDLIEIFGVSEEKITVIYVGVDNKFRVKPNIKKTNTLLYVGHRNDYKNFTTFIASYAASKDLKENFKIVAFGGGAFTKTELDLIQELRIPNKNISQISGGDEKLVDLYNSSAALIYPSVYEGFGSPIIEAMASGCLVFCSDMQAMREAGGLGATYFDPKDISSILDTITSTLSNDELAHNKIALGKLNSKKFSWDKCALETVNVYKSAVA